MSDKKYNIRVYAIIEYEGSVLLTDEFRFGKRMTKFPGGGHEWGEGLADTIRRECEEELAQTPVMIEHFYTTDFFVEAAFRDREQLISIYYKVQLPHPEKIEAKQKPFDFEVEEEGAQIFRWRKITDLTEEEITFPIDKVVAKMLR